MYTVWDVNTIQQIQSSSLPVKHIIWVWNVWLYYGRQSPIDISTLFLSFFFDCPHLIFIRQLGACSRVPHQCWRCWMNTRKVITNIQGTTGIGFGKINWVGKSSHSHTTPHDQEQFVHFISNMSVCVFMSNQLKWRILFIWSIGTYMRCSIVNEFFFLSFRGTSNSIQKEENKNSTLKEFSFFCIPAFSILIFHCYFCLNIAIV